MEQKETHIKMKSVVMFPKTPDVFTGIHSIKNKNKQQSHRKPNDHHMSR